MELAKSWTTHMPMLIKTVQATNGAVLELGSGLYSTPLLHWLCAEDRRTLVTYERSQKYYQLAKRYQSKTHHVMNNLDKLRPRFWSVVFIDNEAKRRKDMAVRFKDSAEFVVLHDSNERIYGYEGVYPLYKYRSDWIFAKPHTTVLSNFRDEKSFNIYKSK
jgi:hypothetical protein